MLSIGILAVIVLCAGGIVWRHRRRWHAYTTPNSPATISRQTLVLRAFAHGNACLAEGKFTEAIAAFQQAREIEPKHLHVTGRLAEVERRQRARRCSSTQPSDPSPRCHPGAGQGGPDEEDFVSHARGRQHVRETAGAGGRILRQSGDQGS